MARESMTDRKCYAGPLAGLQVLDLGHYFAAPMAAMLLADQGASVVRVMKPGPPELAPPQHRLLNRNKQVVALDLKRGEDCARALGLAERADVVIESYRPGVMKRLGLDRASLAERNPGLVYLSLPGFASADVERAGIQAWEGVVSAAACLYQSGLRSRLNFPPSFVPAPICSAFASIHGAISVLAALIARQRGGTGVQIEVPLVSAGISTCTRSFVYDGAALRAEASPSHKLPSFLESLAITPDDDADSQREKQARLAELAPPIFSTHQYEGSDGRKLLVMPIKPEMVERFVTLLGLESQLRLEGFVIESPWARYDLGLGNNLASSWTLSRERSLRVIELVSEVIGRRPAAEWEREFARAGIPVAMLRARDEWLGLPEHLDSGMLLRMEDGRAPLVVPGPVANVSGPDGAYLELDAREPVEIEADVLPRPFERRDLGAGAAAPARKDELLSGLRILDLCNVVAGPNAAYTLAQFGADVIRVEPPKSFNLPMHLEWTLEVNQGKRSAIVDVSTAPGREVFERLVRWADLVVHNRLDAVAERLGMSAEQLQVVNPEVVVCQNSAFGAVYPGPWDEVPGYDPMPNLASGLDVVAGSREAPRAMSEIFGDLMSGLGTAWSAVLGIYQRDRTGYAGSGRSSLARGANFYQLPFMISESGNSDWKQGTGPDARGDRWWQRMYACADGWLYVGAAAERARELARLAAGSPEATEEELERAFAQRDRAYWTARLSGEDFGSHPVLSLDDLCSSPVPRRVENARAVESSRGALEVLIWEAHPSGLPIVLPSPAWSLVGEDRSYTRLEPAPRVGEHTREVLRELGYGDREIEHLYELRVAHDFLPAMRSRDVYFHRQERITP